MLLRSVSVILLGAVSFGAAAQNLLPAGLVEIKASADGKFFLTTAAIDKHPALLIVDTGASEIILTQEFAKESGLKFFESKEDSADSSGRKFTVFRAKVKDLQIGALVVHELSLAVVDFPAFNKSEGIAGLFSPQSYFSKEPFFIDFPRGQLSWGRAIDLKNRETLESLSFHPCSLPDRGALVDLSLNGVAGRFLIDMGAFKSAITTSFSRKLGVSADQSSLREGIAGPTTVPSLKSLKIKMGRISGQLDADVEEHVNGCPDADGKLGIDWLAKYGLLISADRKTIRVIR